MAIRAGCATGPKTWRGGAASPRSRLEGGLLLGWPGVGPNFIAGSCLAPRVNGQAGPEPTLADHKATMEMLRSSANGDPKALAEIEEWGQSRERRLPVLRRFVALLGRHGIVDSGTNRVIRDFVVAQCYAIATRHGLDMMGYVYRDSQSGPLAALMCIDLNAVELDGTDPGSLFPDAGAERAFLGDVRGKGRAELGSMAREAVIPEPERMIPV